MSILPTTPGCTNWSPAVTNSLTVGRVHHQIVDHQGPRPWPRPPPPLSPSHTDAGILPLEAGKSLGAGVEVLSGAAFIKSLGQDQMAWRCSLEPPGRIRFRPGASAGGSCPPGGPSTGYEYPYQRNPELLDLCLPATVNSRGQPSVRPSGFFGIIAMKRARGKWVGRILLFANTPKISQNRCCSGQAQRVIDQVHSITAINQRSHG